MESLFKQLLDTRLHSPDLRRQEIICLNSAEAQKIILWKSLTKGLVSEHVVVQSLSHVQLFSTPWTAAHQASLSFIISSSLLKFMSIESVMLSNHLILCSPLLLLPSAFASIKVFYNEFVLCIRQAKYWSFSLCSSNEYSELICFRIDWFDLLAIQGTLKSLLKQHNSKASIPQHSAFFMVQLLYPYMTMEKLQPMQTFAGKVASLLFNVLSRFVIAFL